MSEEVLSALIGASSALLVVLARDLLIGGLENRSKKRRELISKRIEKIYNPIYILMNSILMGDKERYKSIKEVKRILKEYSYLLSKDMSSKLYLLLSKEYTNIDTKEMVTDFIDEYNRIRMEFYDSHSYQPD